MTSSIQTSSLQSYFRPNETKPLTQQQIVDIKSQDLLQLLENEANATFEHRDLKTTLKLLSEIFSLNELQTMARNKDPQCAEALDEAKALFLEAELYLDTVEHHFETSTQAKIWAFYDSAISILEAFLTAFGIQSFFKPSKNEWDAQGKFGKIMMLLGFSSTISTIFGPTGAVIGAGLLIFIASLSLVFPYIKPMPSRLPISQNWSKMFREGQLQVNNARKESVELIGATFREKRLPMIIGASGVGKTEAVKTFTAAVERGVFPDLIGKQVFYMNTADLIGEARASVMASEGILAKMSNDMGAYRENIILVLDEIHEACKEREHGTICEQLKTRIGLNNDFPFVIGLTTENEYAKHIATNKAFARRFRKIHIDNTQEDETVSIVTHHFLREAPRFICDQTTLRKLVKRVSKTFKERIEPACSLEILQKCIEKMKSPEKSDAEKLLDRRLKKLNSVIAEKALSFASSTKANQRLAALQIKIRELEKQKRVHENDVATTSLQQDLLLEAKKMLCKTVTSLFKHEQNENHLKMFLLLRYFFIPSLLENVKRRAKEVGLSIELNLDLVQASIDEEIEMRKKSSKT